jgi:hypothetical protein
LIVNHVGPHADGKHVMEARKAEGREIDFYEMPLLKR